MATQSNVSKNLSLLDYTSSDSLQKGIGQGAGQIFGQGQQSFDTGARTSDQGMAALAPLISKFTKILTGDATEIDAQAGAEVSGTKDSYQAARDAITRSTPRGGGLSSALAANRSQEAADVAKVRASVTSNAEQGLAVIGSQLLQTGTSEESMGLSAEGGALKDFGGLLNVAMQKEQESHSFWGKIGGTIGAVVGSVLFPPAAPALLGAAVGGWTGGGGGGGKGGVSVSDFWSGGLGGSSKRGTSGMDEPGTGGDQG